MVNNSTIDQRKTKEIEQLPPEADHLLQQRQQEFKQLCQEINLLKSNLDSKYQKLSELQQSFPEKTKLSSQINQQARKLNNLKLNLPNFLIIGVQKGGTTWLHANLKRHPQIFLPNGKKELEFFSYYHKKVADHSLSDYLKHFNQFEDLISTKKPQAIGEATPSYFWSIDSNCKWCTPNNRYFNPQIPESIYNLLGSKTKLILSLRDPVERAISAYFHHIKRDRIAYETQSIFDIGHLHGIIDMGFYSRHLNAWLNKFSLDNFKILIYERDIKQNKQQTIRDLCSFLQVDYQLYPPSANLKQYHNKGLQYRVTEEGAFLIFPESNREKLVINADDIKRLKKVYYDDSMALQQTLDLDLSEFWQLT